MKLYATTTSERASKGQGGNDYLEIEIFVINKTDPLYHVRLNNNIMELLDKEEKVLFIEEIKEDKQWSKFLENKGKKQ